MLKIVNKKRYDSLIKDLTQLSMESVKREVKLAKIENEVEFVKEKYDSLIKENALLKETLDNISQMKERKKKEDLSEITIKDFDKDLYIAKFMERFRKGIKH